MQEANHVELSFTCDFDERTQWEVQQKGWFDQAFVHLPDGSKMHVCFWDPVRLSQDLATDLKLGKACIAEPGMIVISQVTLNNMKAAVEELYHRGYFNQLRSRFQ